MAEAIVVGSGPNGLAAALTLAEAGLRVRVIEAAETVGGGVRSAELTVPGLVHDECSALHPFATSSPFARHFDLSGDGLRWRWAPYEFAHPLDGGRGAAVSRSVSRTADTLGADGPAWERVFGPLTASFDSVAQEILQPLLHVPRHPVRLARFGTYAAQPATTLTRRWSAPETQALFAGAAAHGFGRLDAPFSSAVGVALAASAHAYGWAAAEGGSQAIADAIVRRLERLLVRIETGRRVESLDELGELGREVDVVMLDTAPGAAARIIGDRLPDPVRRAYSRYRHGPAAFRVSYAVHEGVPWAYEPARSAAVVHAGGTIAEIASAEAGTNSGRLAQSPFVLVCQQYLADPSRSVGDLHPVDAYAHVPHGWDGPDDIVTDAVTAQIERFAPGFRDRVAATHVRSTTDLAAHNPNHVGGDIANGAADLRQIVLRPRPTTNPYATGVPGVWLCSSATPPGAGAHGMCGYLAAIAALDGL